MIKIIDLLDTGFGDASLAVGYAANLISHHITMFIINPLRFANGILLAFKNTFASVATLTGEGVKQRLALAGAGSGAAAAPEKSSADAGGGGGKDTARQDAVAALKREEKDIANTLREAHAEAIREYENYKNSLQGAFEKIRQAEEDAFIARRDNLLKQRELAKNQGEREAIDDELLQAQKDKDRAIEEARRDRDKKEIAALTDHLNNLQSLYDEATKRMADALRDQADHRVMSYEDAEKRIKQIQEDNFNQQLNRLKEQQERILKAAGFELDDKGSPIEGTGDPSKLNNEALQKSIDDFDRLNATRLAAQEKADRDIRAAREKDLANEREYYNKLTELREEHRQKEIATQRERLTKILENTNETKRARMDALVELVNLDLRELEVAYNHHLDMIDIRERELKSLATTEQQKADAEAQALAARQQALDAFEQARRDRVNAAAGEAQGVQGGGFLDGLFGTLGEGQTKGIHDMTEALTVFGQVAGSVFGGLAQGIGGLITNWVNLGTAGPNALRKLLAAVLATAAGQAAVEAIMETARGIKETALASASAAVFDFHGAALHSAAAAAHFNAAIVFGLIAGGAAVIGKAVAPAASAGGQGAQASGFGGSNRTGSSSSGSSTSDEEKIIEQDRNRNSIAGDLPEHRELSRVAGVLEGAVSALNNAADAVRSTLARVTVDLNVKSDEGHTVDLMKRNLDGVLQDNFRHNGKFRQMTIAVAEGNY